MLIIHYKIKKSQLLSPMITVNNHHNKDCENENENESHSLIISPSSTTTSSYKIHQITPYKKQSSFINQRIKQLKTLLHKKNLQNNQLK